MKHIFLLLFAIFSVSLLVSCQSDQFLVDYQQAEKLAVTTIDVDEAVRYTDTPPAAMFEAWRDYGTTFVAWVDSASFYDAVSLGTDSTTYNKGEWHLGYFPYYWGIYDGHLYVSESKYPMVIDPQTYKEGPAILENKTCLNQIYFGQWNVQSKKHPNDPTYKYMISGWLDKNPSPSSLTPTPPVIINGCIRATDAPPTQISRTSGTSNLCWIDSISLANSISLGVKTINSQTGEWFVGSFPYYWGIYDGHIYVSKTKYSMTIGPWIYTEAKNKVFRKKTCVASLTSSSKSSLEIYSVKDF